MPTRTDPTALAVLPLPEQVRSDLGAVAVRPLAGGGSAARLWRVERATGGPVVVKETTVADGLVDGHDLDTFRRKPRQVALVHTRLPRLSPHYPAIVGEWSGPGWAAYAMPWYDGVPLVDRPAETERVFGILTADGYAAESFPAPPDHFATVHVGRLAGRLPLLRRFLEPELFDRDRVEVNGRSCRTLPALLAALRADGDLHAAMRPGRLAPPVHGDLNLGNVLVRPDGGFVVLDPRGVLDPWDPVYDFAKALFSLTVFEQAMAGGFTVDGDAAAGYRVALRLPPLDAAGFLPMLDRLPYAATLDRHDPRWRRRLLVSHAVHCLAESACRLSDRKPRAYGEVRGAAACLLLARGLHLAGLRLLEDVLTGPDPAAVNWSAGPDRPGS